MQNSSASRRVSYETECFYKMIQQLESKVKLSENTKHEDLDTNKYKLKKIMATTTSHKQLALTSGRLDRSKRSQRYTWHSFEQQQKKPERYIKNGLSTFITDSEIINFMGNNKKRSGSDTLCNN